jgi:hypothetical protein
MENPLEEETSGMTTGYHTDAVEQTLMQEPGTNEQLSGMKSSFEGDYGDKEVCIGWHTF